MSTESRCSESNAPTMADYIKLPRANIDARLLHNAETCRLYLYLLAQADDGGFIETKSSKVERDLGLSRQQLRTLLMELEATNKITKQSTNKATKILLCGISGCTRPQPTKQPIKQPTFQPAVTCEISSDALSFVDPRFRDAFNTWIEYKKHELKERYKTERTLQAAYKKLVELSGYDPCKAMRIVEQSMANRWKGLFELKDNGTRITADSHASRKAQRDRGLSLATEIVSRSENLLNLYNGCGADPFNCENQK